jgi:vanillate O-demethylase ferredoxin subunit
MSSTADGGAVLDRLESRAPVKMAVVLRSITLLAESTCSFEFVDPQGKALPAFTAGSHVDVHLPDGPIRQYSLCNDPAERHRYVVAVLRESTGRGGSLAMHDGLRVGTTLTISQPRNHFALAGQALRHVFVAGGIGITPIMSMIAKARAAKADFHLYYCTRSPERTAFLQQLQPLAENGCATIHHDGGQAGNNLDLEAALGAYRGGTHVYYCGPPGFLDAVARALRGWPAEAVHVERFGTSATAPGASSDGADGAGDANDLDLAFDVELARSGGRFTVAPGRSIANVLKENGIEVDVSCEKGQCATCMTRYLAGEPLHRDSVLDAQVHEQFMTICCSRAKSKVLVLDL